MAIFGQMADTYLTGLESTLMVPSKMKNEVITQYYFI